MNWEPKIYWKASVISTIWVYVLIGIGSWLYIKYSHTLVLIFAGWISGIQFDVDFPPGLP